MMSERHMRIAANLNAQPTCRMGRLLGCLAIRSGLSSPSHHIEGQSGAGILGIFSWRAGLESDQFTPGENGER
jgi:hypothetical protein